MVVLQYTTNYNLKKPEGTDVVNIYDLNANADIIDTELAKRMINSGGVPSIQSGLDADKPTAGTTGRLYIATDTQIIYRDTGTAWQKVGAVKWGDIDGKPASFTPSAHKSTHAIGGSDPLTPADIGAVNKAGDIIKPSADSTTVFQVQKSDGSVVLDVDTTNKRVGIGTNSPGQPLEVNGNIKTTSQFISTVATGTAPLQVSSTTTVTNLNADMTDNIHFRVYNGSLQYNDGTGWQNVMTSVIKSIQRGVLSSNISSKSSVTVTISSVDISKSVVILSSLVTMHGGSDYFIFGVDAQLVNSTSLQFTSNKDGWFFNIAWQVVEYV